MKKHLPLPLAGLMMFGMFAATAAETPAGALPLSTELLPEAAAKRMSEQSVDSGNVNGTFSATLVLDVDALKEALKGGRLQILDAHLNAGRKSATNIGFAMEDGVVHFTHMRFHRAQSDPMAATSSPSLQEFAQDEARLASICGAVVTFVHASGHNQGACPSGSYYYLDLYTADGVRSFTGYAENLRVSDRRLGSVAIPQGSPAVSGAVFVEKALTPEEASAANAQMAAAGR